MKILAIRGKNIASLQREFEIDFAKEPLASAGLFAICGPTGAGKSSLLDVICLALYDETPRLNHAGTGSLPEAGDKSITFGDPRNLLTRGAGEGYAEVEFAGQDGEPYRARWGIHRARKKSDGNLSNSTLTLTRVADGQVLGGTKGEVLKEIRNRLGLTFHQFTRAVLLAQNDFAAFLKANADERAVLLEALTGTEEYSKLSVRAFERNKAEQEKLKQLKDKLQDDLPLALENRAALEETQRAQTQELQALGGKKAQWEAVLRWFGDLAAAVASVEKAGEELRNAQAAQEAARGRQAELQLTEAVQPARPLVAESQRLQVELAEAAQKLAEAQTVVATAQAALMKAAVESDEATARLGQAEAGDKLLRPLFQKAREFDTELATLRPAFEQVKLRAESAKQKKAQAEQELGKKQEARAQVATELEATQSWLSTNQLLEPLAREWPRWEKTFRSAAQERVDVGNMAALRKRLAAEQDSQAQTLTELASQAAVAEGAFRTAETALAGETAALTQFDHASLGERRSALQTRQEQLGAAQAAWREVQEGERAHEEAVARLAALDRGLAECGKLLADARKDLPEARRAEDVARISFQAVKDACGESVERLREALVEGAPCSVCGATEHPYRRADALLRERLAALEAAWKESSEKLRALQQTEATQEALRIKFEQEKPGLAQLLAQAEERRGKAVKAWEQQPLAAEIGPVVETGRPAWFVAALETLREQQKKMAAEEAAYQTALRQREDMARALEVARQAKDAAEKARHSAEMAAKELASRLQAENDKHTAATGRLNNSLDELEQAGLVAGWRKTWEADPGQFAAECAKRAAQWNEFTTKRAQLEAQHNTLQVEVTALTTAAAAASAAYEEVSKEFVAFEKTLEQREQARADVLGATPYRGKSVAEGEHGQEALLMQLREEVRKKDGALKLCQDARLSAEHTRNGLAELHSELAAKHSAAGNALSEWLAKFQAGGAAMLTIDRLGMILARDHAWLNAERQALNGIAMRIAKAVGALDEHKLRVAELEKTRPTTESKEAVEESLGKLEAELKEKQSLLSDLEHRVRTDNERKQRSAALQTDLQAQEARAKQWAQLNMLIGSADGKKFRNFAQQLTLDVLLGYANHELRQLAGRYRLERNGDTLDLLIVDQDMGDEKRSVHSLSGGESFLVSLALALGLAALSSQTIKVGSLFVDEGFGSLDADTLRVAMDALDSLQAMGRKVGVISHVQEMTERIGVQIQVRKTSGGKSEVVVTGERGLGAFL